MNQETRIVNHLLSEGHITGVIAEDLYRVRDLPKRISVIQQKDMLPPGCVINKRLKRDRLGGRYMRYTVGRARA